MEICPAEINPQLKKELERCTRAVFRALGLGAYARVDFMVDDNGVYCLEANTTPGMTPTSLLPQEAAAVGMEFPALLENIIAESMKLERKQNE